MDWITVRFFGDTVWASELGDYLKAYFYTKTIYQYGGNLQIFFLNPTGEGAVSFLWLLIYVNASVVSPIRWGYRFTFECFWRKTLWHRIAVCLCCYGPTIPLITIDVIPDQNKTICKNLWVILYFAKTCNNNTQRDVNRYWKFNETEGYKQIKG